jgi:hypothetical protein
VQPAAFVTFNDRLTASMAATGLQAHDELAWRVQVGRKAGGQGRARG